jgi:hypothetical protein
LHVPYKYEFYVPITGIISPEAFSERRLRTIENRVLRTVFASEEEEVRVFIIGTFAKYY